MCLLLFCLDRRCIFGLQAKKRQWEAVNKKETQTAGARVSAVF